ncbi:MAG TPA: hypothetical protein VM869_12460 [Enhygromyxa sp.]|nr:hypothetical protein [Enhygromyxa sp.]
MASTRARGLRLISPFVAVIGSVVAALTIGCAEDPVETGRTVQAEQATSEATSGHIGRIHVVLQPRPDELEPEPELQIHARFVEYRGVSETQVRARASLPVPVWEQLVMGQCIASEALLPVAGPLPPGDHERELSMIDAGDLRVALGNRELVAPVSLVPDILPWLSGVEYGHVDDRIPWLAVEPDGTAPVTVSIDGSADGSLEPFSVSVLVPAQLTLEAAKVTDDRLTIDWRPPGHPSQFVVLRLQAFTPGEDGVNEPTGEEVTCLVADSGRTDFSLGPLESAGLAAQAELLRVSVSRFDVTQVRAGSFGAVDVLIELRAQKLLSPPRL